MFTVRIVIATLLLLSAGFSQAQQNLAKINPVDAFPVVRDLNWLNEQFLIKQRKSVESVTRSKFGQSLKIGQGNIPLLQRIINEQLIPTDDKLELQALGVVLGDVIVDYDKILVWQVYEDEKGSSHAVCITKTEHCLFPVTMLSRRIEAGVPKVDVRRIYNKAIDLIKLDMPKRAYSN